jgi:hypothetical protein
MKAVQIRTVNFAEFAELSHEFGFDHLKAKLSEFCPWIGPKKTKDAEERPERNPGKTRTTPWQRTWTFEASFQRT